MYFIKVILKHALIYILTMLVGVLICSMGLSIGYVLDEISSQHLTIADIIFHFTVYTLAMFPFGILLAIPCTIIPIVCLCTIKRTNLKDKKYYILSGMISPTLAWIMLDIPEKSALFVIAGAISGLLYYKLDNKFKITNDKSPIATVVN
ncbi:MAG: hypothetical protein K0R98_884 [Rickettsiaceae bacterium]|jgi:hypothetical protein|nr:hypothetical protein [Rickettsiaceae bacterium]